MKATKNGWNIEGTPDEMRELIESMPSEEQFDPAIDPLMEEQDKEYSNWLEAEAEQQNKIITAQNRFAKKHSNNEDVNVENKYASRRKAARSNVCWTADEHEQLANLWSDGKPSSSKINAFAKQIGRSPTAIIAQKNWIDRYGSKEQDVVVKRSKSNHYQYTGADDVELERIYALRNPQEFDDAMEEFKSFRNISSYKAIELHARRIGCWKYKQSSLRDFMKKLKLVKRHIYTDEDNAELTEIFKLNPYKKFKKAILKFQKDNKIKTKKSIIKHGWDIGLRRNDSSTKSDVETEQKTDEVSIAKIDFSANNLDVPIKLFFDIVKNMLKTNGSMTYGYCAYPLNIENKLQWRTFVESFMIQSAAIAKECGVENNFKAITMGDDKYVIIYSKEV
jgi:hypothetical protein